ncbi:hypothetical protein GNP57_18805 [Aliivibrio fischeri]|uniref:hypothetical protein n=2 Tax=Aliivibrio fischeri TaxID=668 RepID=UPI0012DAD2EB|nr:hypothetical protein [Aliivibrio fischeri]MUL15542.1 hypothetical protein [Aliivibrio fischeri]
MINENLSNCLKQFYSENEKELTDLGVVVKMPYVPYIPSSWNGTLVLAEAQNLSKNNQNYVDKLNEASVEKQIHRLSNPDSLGILPWDDNSLKIAVELGLEQNNKEVAVSNACFWSQRNEKGFNANPSIELQNLSVKLWNLIFSIMNPKIIITVGKVTSNIIKATEFNGHVYSLCHPSSNYLSRFSGLIDEKYILDRFPEIKELDNRYPTWMVRGNYRQNKLFFAMHSLSRLKAI